MQMACTQDKNMDIIMQKLSSLGYPSVCANAIDFLRRHMIWRYVLIYFDRCLGHNWIFLIAKIGETYSVPVASARHGMSVFP